jgi:hypothetical protein
MQSATRMGAWTLMARDGGGHGGGDDAVHAWFWHRQLDGAVACTGSTRFVQRAHKKSNGQTAVFPFDFLRGA